MEPAAQDKATEPAHRPAPNLERDKVVAAALELLDEVGFEGLTLRRLADKLGVKAAALYWHFKNKQDLIDQVAAKIITPEGDTHIPQTADWQAVIRLLAVHSRSSFMRYRDGALLIANADLTGEAPQKGRDYVVQQLVARGFSEADASLAIFTVGRYTLGCVIEEQSDPRSADRAATSDKRFEAGLQLLLAGIAQKITQ
ncbi:MAG TPA: TetR/AcrR family transcriptional regulator C-terminal domain-containing protein [Candidatus Saccharimonadales bacterium]|nr:TetR/AcrR family transcriptional regulator C-terminal domain-containing protein [Candidatus Saccharimonadales bacterium]